MSLLDQYGESFIVMNKTRTPDGEGGFVTTWSDGAVIQCAIRHDSSIEARKAEQDGLTSVYTILASRNIGLEYHDVLKRVRDGEIFRVTGNAGEDVTPRSATLDLTAVSAEKWRLPS